MRAAIEAVATCAEPGLGSRALAIRAAARALQLAGRSAASIEMLVNTGIYRDEHIIEPAMAPFVQRGIDANASFPTSSNAATFSFDLANGAGGPITAMSVVAGFMRSGRVRAALVVASDTDPDPTRSEGYPFVPAGGAILLRTAPDVGGAGDANGAAEGFAWFEARTWSEHFGLFEARLCGTDDAEPLAAQVATGASGVVWDGAAGGTAPGTAGAASERRAASSPDAGAAALSGGGSLATLAVGAAAQRLRVRESEAFLDRCVDCAARTVEDVARRRSLDLRTVDLLVVAPLAPRLTHALAERIGLARLVASSPHDEVVPPPALHTAATAFALERAVLDGSWERARRALFVAIGAGVTVSLGLYERDPATAQALR